MKYCRVYWDIVMANWLGYMGCGCVCFEKGILSIDTWHHDTLLLRRTMTGEITVKNDCLDDADDDNNSDNYS